MIALKTPLNYYKGYKVLTFPSLAYSGLWDPLLTTLLKKTDINYTYKNGHKHIFDSIEVHILDVID